MWQACKSKIFESSIELRSRFEINSPYLRPAGGRSTRAKDVDTVQPPQEQAEAAEPPQEQVQPEEVRVRAAPEPQPSIATSKAKRQSRQPVRFGDYAPK